VKTFNPTLQADRGRPSLAWLVAALFGLVACSDSPTAPGDYPSAALAATITSWQVLVGDSVTLTFTPTRPCWGEAAEMEVQLSWDTTRFAWIDTPGVGIEYEGGGRIRVRGVDRDGFSNGMNVALRALTDGGTDGFHVDDVVMRCESHRVMVFFDPALRAAPKP